MQFDPAADPWGTAMLAAAALWLLALLVVLAAVLGRTSRRTGGYLMLVSLLAFLVAAAGGTWERIRESGDLVADAPAMPDEAVAKVPVDSGEAAGAGGGSADAGGSTGAAAGGDPPTGGDEPTGTAGGATGDATTGGATGDAATGDAATGEPAASDTGDPTGGEEPTSDTDDPTGGEEPAADAEDSGQVAVIVPPPGEPEVPENLPKVEPLPTEPGAREQAIREILEEGARAAGGGERCGNLERVAKAWARLETIPVTRKAKKVAADLERCRRRLLYSVSQKRLEEMVEARDAWFEKLPTKLRKEHGLIVQAAMTGGDHQRLRIGNRQLDEAHADALMESGLRDEMLRLQFAHVVISNGKKSKTYELPVTPVGELGLPWLRAVGLGEPLELVAKE